MDRKSYLYNLRQNGLLKGQKPCFITLKQNYGKIYNGGTADYIMSYRDGVLYFQKISFFLKRLQPKEDFTIHTDRFIEYKFTDKTFMTILSLYDKENKFIEIYYQKGTIETASTEDNIQRIVDIMKEHGLKEESINEEVND